MKLAIDGGTPVRAASLPYGRHSVDERDIAAVVDVLRSDWLTTGPSVARFEAAFCETTGAKHAIAVVNGTAALHAAMHALDVGPGDEVIVPTMTFAASANAAVYMGATPVFCDVDPATLLIDPADAARRRSARTKAVVAVDYAGQPTDADALTAALPGLPVVADACHALGAVDEKGRRVGTRAVLSTFSFHPVKPVTTGEGGMITTDDAALASKMRIFRNHGITTDHRQREQAASFFYEMVTLGYNYRLSDIGCALGIAQLSRLEGMTARRRAIAQQYAAKLSRVDGVRPLAARPGVQSAWHLYVVALDLDLLHVNRAQVFRALRAENIGVNVHYIPVHHHPFYRQRFGTMPGTLPQAEGMFERILTLPIFPAMNDADVDDVVAALEKVIAAYRR